MGRTDDRQPEPTEFNVIIEGDPNRPIRIRFNRVVHHPPAMVDIGAVLSAVLDAAYNREESDVRAVFVNGVDG